MKFLREYFQLNKREERGIYFLIVLILLLSILRYFAPYMNEYLYPTNKQELIIESIPLIKLQKESKTTKKRDYKKKNSKLSIKRKFDPNTISLNELIKMKLPIYIANNWIKYRNAGVTFKKEQDLLKIYGLDSLYYTQIKGWIEFPKAELMPSSEERVFVSKPKESIKKEIIQIGINTADSIELLKVNGVGPFYAGAIVNYRERLGGFIHINQLMELYKMDSLKFNRMTQQLYLDEINIKKISINNDDFKSILRHPYIDYETTKYIVNKRNKLGKYAALYQLLDSTSFPQKKYDKLISYLSLD